MDETETNQEKDININKNKKQESGVLKTGGDWEVNLERLLSQEKEDEEAIFSRRNSIRRTPTKGGSTSGNIDEDDSVFLENKDTEEVGKANSGGDDDDCMVVNDIPEGVLHQKNKKRKFSTSPGTNSRNVKEVEDPVLTKIVKNVNALYIFKEQHKSVHKEIKDGIATPKSLLRTYTKAQGKKTSKLQEQNEEETIETRKTQKYQEIEVNHKKMEQETATLRKEMEILKKDNEELKAKCKRLEGSNRKWERIILEEDLNGVNSYEDYQTIKNNRWEESLYKNVKTKIGNPVIGEEEIAVVITMPENRQMTQSVQRMYAERYPDLKEITCDIGTLTCTTSISTNGELKQKNKKIIKVNPVDMEEGLWSALAGVRNEAVNEGARSIAVHRLAAESEEVMKRALQCIFNKTGIEVALYKPNNGVPATERKPRKPYDTKAVEVHKNVDFKELLGEVKSSLSDTSLCKDIKTVRSTRAGSLLIVLDKNGSTEEIKKALRTKIPECKVKSLERNDKERTKTLYIRGMEATATKKEVEESIHAFVGSKETTIGEIRPSRSNTTAVTIQVNKETADKLLNSRGIKIGLSTVRTEGIHLRLLKKGRKLLRNGSWSGRVMEKVNGRDC